MSAAIKPGDTVRILPSYAELWGDASGRAFMGETKPGVEFVVREVRSNAKINGSLGQFVTGDPSRRGVWVEYVERVFPEPKMFTTTTIATREHWINQDRIVSVTSGRGGLSLNVRPNLARHANDTSGRTGLTPEQAEQLANDLLERVAEIRAGLKEEAGE